MTRILLCASSPVTLAGLESVIGSDHGAQIVGRQASLADAARAIDRTHPDIIVVVIPEESDEALTQLNAITSSVRAPALVALTEKNAAGWASELLRAGVRSVLPLDVEADEMRAAIAAAASGLLSLHADFAASIVSPLGATRSFGAGTAQLTARERDVLQMLADGQGNKTIARRLGISMHTVKFHVGSIMSKLHATSRTEAVTVGIRQGLILL